MQVYSIQQVLAIFAGVRPYLVCAGERKAFPTPTRHLFSKILSEPPISDMKLVNIDEVEWGDKISYGLTFRDNRTTESFAFIGDPNTVFMQVCTLMHSLAMADLAVRRKNSRSSATCSCSHELLEMDGGETRICKTSGDGDTAEILKISGHLVIPFEYIEKSEMIDGVCKPVSLYGKSYYDENCNFYSSEEQSVLSVIYSSRITGEEVVFRLDNSGTDFPLYLYNSVLNLSKKAAEKEAESANPEE